MAKISEAEFNQIIRNLPLSERKLCWNCYGTGTTFGHKKALIVGGHKCKICNGGCWVPTVKVPECQ